MKTISLSIAALSCAGLALALGCTAETSVPAKPAPSEASQPASAPSAPSALRTVSLDLPAMT